MGNPILHLWVSFFCLRREHCIRKASCRRKFVSDQRPGRGDQTGIFFREHQVVLKGLPRRVDIFPADLEKIFFFAEPMQTLDLFEGISGRRIRHRVKSAAAHFRNEHIQERVFKGLRLFISGHGICHVAEISVSGNCAGFLRKRSKRVDRGAFLGCVHVKLLHEIRLEHAEQIIGVK